MFINVNLHLIQNGRNYKSMMFVCLAVYLSREWPEILTAYLEILGSGRSTGEGIGYPLPYSWASFEAQLEAAMQFSWATELNWIELKSLLIYQASFLNKVFLHLTSKLCK